MPNSYFVTDQFGVPLPDLTRILNDRAELLKDTRTAVNGMVSFAVSDNPLAGITSEEAAEVLGKVPQTVRDLCLKGAIRAMRYPERWRIPKRAIALYEATVDLAQQQEIDFIDSHELQESES